MSIKPEEAVYGFLSWLTKRFDQVTLSQHNNSEVAYKLAERYCKANGWKVPKESDWEDDLVEPPLYD